MPAFDEYVTSRLPTLLRFAYLLTGDAHLAEDITQDVLAKAHRRWARIETMQYLDAYLRRAVVNQFLSWRRRRSSSERTVAELPERYQQGGDPADRHAERSAMWALLATLPRQQRAVLVLRFYEDLDDQAIAELIGCRRSSVRVHASRGLATLRAAMPTVTTPLEVR